MSKWYEEPLCDEGIIISSRIRLARNLKKFVFPSKINKEESLKMLTEVKNAIINDRTPIAKDFKFIEVNNLTNKEKRTLIEHHAISPLLSKKLNPCGVLINEDETISIMINEEDHIRIQTVFAGEQINKAWDLANKIDNLLEESVEYAFNENIGYITSCPTNIGSGLRASFMAHIPAIEKAGQLKNLITALGKFGITVRGIYGEGSEGIGGIYQISNQITLGQSEEEIIKNLENAITFVKEQENRFREFFRKKDILTLKDDIYRSYGILKNAYKITAKEAINHLSNIKLGYTIEILAIPKPKKSIYNMIIDVQSVNTENNTIKEEEARATYLRNVLSP